MVDDTFGNAEVTNLDKPGGVRENKDILIYTGLLIIHVNVVSCLWRELSRDLGHRISDTDRRLDITMGDSHGMYTA